MRYDYRETFRLPLDEVFCYFSTPRDWVQLFGFAGPVNERGGGWYSVPLRGFPIPLITRLDEVVQGHRIHWVFRGFWRGEGECNLEAVDGGVTISGFEDISIPHCLGIGPWIERIFLQRPFERLWKSGWRRLHVKAAERDTSRANMIAASG